MPVLTVRVLDDAGKGVADGAVWWRTSDAGGFFGWNAVTCRPDGTARVPGMTPVDLLARRVGSGFASASRVMSGTTLRLPPARVPSSVEVVLADGVRIPAPPFRLAVRLGRADDDHPDARIPPPSDPRNAGRPEPSFASDARRVTVAVSEPGRYDAVVMLWIETAGAGHGMPLPLDGRATTTVGTDGARQTIVVRFTPEALAAAMSALRDE